MSPDPRQNRVDPCGDLIATPARGAWMGNRGGALHDEHGRIRRTHTGRRWIYCLLEFKGRRRQVMQPGKYTELFFLDEPTALAAGHRPCAECQRSRYNELRAAWPGVNDPKADEMDRVLHPERIDSEGRKVTFEGALGELPDGSMVMAEFGDQGPTPALLWDGMLHRWTPGGYDSARHATAATQATVLTPQSLVEVLARGFEIQPAPR